MKRMGALPKGTLSRTVKAMFLGMPAKIPSAYTHA
jgi:hypothetical protein